MDKLEKLLEDIKNKNYEKIDFYLDEAIQEYEELESKDFWCNWVFPDGANAQQIKDELCDYRVILNNVSKVYDYITCGRVSKPNTFAHAVIDEFEEFWERKERI